MRKFLNAILQKKGVVNALSVVGCMSIIMARKGFFFYIYHQPKLPESLRDME